MLVTPFKSVGNLFFSDSRQEIKRKLNEKFISGQKGVEEKGFEDLTDYYDYFEQSELFVYYDKDDKINAFEFFKANPVFNGTNLLMESFDNLVKMFSAIDDDLSSSSYEFTSNKFGIGANAANDDEGNITFAEAVIIFKQGYYDRLQEYIDSLGL